LLSPRPAPAFSPYSDQMRRADLRKDQKIEDRIRPKKRPLPSELPPAASAEVDKLMKMSNPAVPVSKCSREQVYAKDIARLKPRTWLNDELVNFYGALIMERAEKAEASNNGVNGVKVNGLHGKFSAVNGLGPKLLKVHFFNTFFYPKVVEGYEKSKLSRWTKKIDIFKKDIVLIPVNHTNSHWTAAAINFRRKRVESYDSMGIRRADVVANLRKYLDKEHMDKKKKPFDFSGWDDFMASDDDKWFPQQENGFDCGVFTCQYLEALSRGEEMFAFTQKDMPYLRRKMVWEIGRVALGDPT